MPRWVQGHVPGPLPTLQGRQACRSAQADAATGSALALPQASCISLAVCAALSHVPLSGAGAAVCAAGGCPGRQGGQARGLPGTPPGSKRCAEGCTAPQARGGWQVQHGAA